MKTNRNSKFIIKREDWRLGLLLDFIRCHAFWKIKIKSRCPAMKQFQRLKSVRVAARTPQYKTLGHWGQNDLDIEILTNAPGEKSWHVPKTIGFNFATTYKLIQLALDVSRKLLVLQKRKCPPLPPQKKIYIIRRTHYRSKGTNDKMGGTLLWTLSARDSCSRRRCPQLNHPPPSHGRA